MHERTKLANGIVVAAEEIPTVRSVSVGLWLRTGSINENAGNNGVSHFLEHMLFKGTPQHSAREIAEAVDGIGGQLNAFTSREYTCLYARVLDEHLEFVLSLLCEMLRESCLDPLEMEKERGVILEEINMYQDDPAELVHDLFAQTIFYDHPLGRPILGTTETVGGLTREDLKDYIDHYYTPQRLLVAAAGNVKQEQLARIVEENLGIYTKEHVPDRHQPFTFVQRAETISKQIEQVHLVVGAPGVARQDPDRYPLEVLEVIIGSGMSSRLFQELREERGLVYSTYSFHSLYHKEGLWGAYAATGKEQAQTALDAIVAELDSLVKKPVKPEELSRAKEQLKGSLLISLESTSSRMSRIAKGELFKGEAITLEEELAAIEAVTEEDLQRVAQRLFTNGLSLAAIGPFSKELTLPVL